MFIIFAVLGLVAGAVIGALIGAVAGAAIGLLIAGLILFFIQIAGMAPISVVALVGSKIPVHANRKPRRI